MEKNLYSKSSAALDISYVQMMKFIEVGGKAIRTAIMSDTHPPKIKSFYAKRDEAFKYVKKME